MAHKDNPNFKKCLEAMFRGCFSQVQHVNLKNKNYVRLPGVFIKVHKKFEQNLREDYGEKKICRKTKKSALGESRHMLTLSSLQTHCDPISIFPSLILHHLASMTVRILYTLYNNCTHSTITVYTVHIL